VQTGPNGGQYYETDEKKPSEEEKPSLQSGDVIFKDPYGRSTRGTVIGYRQKPDGTKAALVSARDYRDRNVEYELPLDAITSADMDQAGDAYMEQVDARVPMDKLKGYAKKLSALAEGIDTDAPDAEEKLTRAIVAHGQKANDPIIVRNAELIAAAMMGIEIETEEDREKQTRLKYMRMLTPEKKKKIMDTMYPKLTQGFKVDRDEPAQTRERLARALERHPRFLERWCDAAERAAIAAAADPLGEALRRFCLKEALVKALWKRARLTPRQASTAALRTQRAAKPSRR